MIAASLPLAALVAGAQEVAPAPTIAPPAGKAAVRATDEVALSGAATGLSDGPIQVALVGFGTDGVMFREENVPGVTVEGGQYRGSVTLGCGFGEHNTPRRCAEVNPSNDLVTGVAVEPAGAARSNVLRVDYVDPEIVRYETVDATTVRVVFSEPVRMPAVLGQRLEKAQDWSVEDQLALAISDPKEAGCAFANENLAQGCTRLLTLPSPGHGEDDTPFVDYLPITELAVISPVYVDFADNGLGIAAAENSSAVDRIRPAVPNIETINGTTPTDGTVIGTSTEPSVTLTNLTAGHDVKVTLKRPGAAAVVVEQSVPEDAGAAEGASSIVVPVPSLPGQGEYLVSAVAIDAAGNRSNDQTKRGPRRADGASGTVNYVVDTVAPIVAFAGVENATTIEVLFSEPVAPNGPAGTWTVGDETLEATGTGDARTLVASNALNVTAPLTLKWQPSSTTYTDQSGNALAPLEIGLDELPPLRAPTVTSPSRTTFLKTQTQVIKGTGPVGENIVAELFERGETEAVATSDASDGSWTFSAPLEADRRYQFQVRLRSTDTDVVSRRVSVPDVVRDTSAPVVEVLAPVGSGLPPALSSPPEYGPGDSVTVEWRATDAATGDPEMNDHGSVANIVLVRADGVRRVVGQKILHQAGTKQSHSVRLTSDDLGGSGLRDFTFDVRVRDLAGNVGADASGAIRLLADRIGYTPVVVASRTIEVRFGRMMKGTVGPNDWLVDGSPAASQVTERDGNTVIRLTAPFVTDPNARPRVKFAPTLPQTERLRSNNDTQVSKATRTAVDKIKPLLDFEAPTAKLVDASGIRFAGTTDVTGFPNRIAAYRSDASGSRRGAAIATTKANADGSWSFRVPLDANRRNWIVLRVTDPSGNNSPTSSPYTVVEDSVAPVVRVIVPRTASRVGPAMTVRWATVEKNKKSALLQYRPRNASNWRRIATTADDGAYRWDVPDSLGGRYFQLQVVATDRLGKRGADSSKALLADFRRPVLRRATAVGAKKVRLYFSERMDMTREGWTVDGIGVDRVVKDGDRQTLILNRSLGRTTPTVVYNDNRARDLAGNRLADRRLTAERGFVFSVTDLDVDRLSRSRARLEWRDARNRPAHVKHYRIYRNGNRIGTVSWDRRSFKDTNAAGSNRYVVRAVDINGRVSSAKEVRT